MHLDQKKIGLKDVANNFIIDYIIKMNEKYNETYKFFVKKGLIR